MSKVDLYTCAVMLAGDARQIVHKPISDPVTLPEMLVLQYLHGPESVMDVTKVSEREGSSESEIDRLKMKFGPERISNLFPGVRPQLELSLPEQPSAEQPSAEQPSAEQPPAEPKSAKSGDRKAANDKQTGLFDAIKE